MRRSHLLPAVLILLFASGLLAATDGSPEAAADPPAEIRGTVLDPQGEPATGATVRFRRVYTQEDRETKPAEGYDPNAWRTTVLKSSDDGSFVAADLRGRLFDVRAEAEGLAPAYEPKVKPGATLEVRLEAGQSLSGRILDRQTGDPIAGATVLVCDDSSLKFGRDGCRSVETDDEGRFDSRGLAPSAHLLEAVAPAHELIRERGMAVPQEVDPDTEEPRVVELFLGPGARVAGEVRDSEDGPVHRAQVLLAPRSRGREELRMAPVRTNAEGRFDFPGAPVGEYDLRVSAKGLPQPEPLPIEVEAGRDRTDIVVRFSAGAMLKLRLVDPDDAPVSGLELHVSAVQSDAGRRRFGVDPSRIQAGEGGRYTVEGLPPGEFELEIDPSGWRDLNVKEVTILEGETTDLGKLVLDEGGSISGSVTDDAGEPVPNSHVQASWRAPDFRGYSKHTRTGEDGRYRLSGLEDDGMLDLVKVRLPDYAPAIRKAVAVGEEGVDFVLQRTGGFEGIVLRPDGTPATKFRVEARAESAAADTQDPVAMVRRMSGAADHGRSFSDPEGKFTLKALPPGKYKLSATAGGYAAAHRPYVAAVGGEIADVGTLTLREGLRVSGRVVAMEDESPVPGANLSVAPAGLLKIGVPIRPLASASSDVEGLFRFEGLEPGSFNVTADHPDYPSVEVSLRLDEGVEAPDLVVRLGVGGTIRGTVLDDAGQPWPGVTLMLSEGSPMNQSGRAVSGADGTYAFEKVRPGDYLVMLSKGSLADVRTKPAKVEAHETTVVNFGDEPSIRLRGRLLLRGAGLGDRLLMFTLDGATRTARTDAEGGFEIGLDQAGSYQVIVTGGDAVAAIPMKVLELTVPDESVVYREIAIEGASIRGRVVDAENRPVAAAGVSALRTGGAASTAGIATATTDSEGLYTMDGVEPGVYRLVVQAGNFARAEREQVTVEDGSDLVEDFTLEERGRVRGRVVGPQGQGLGGAWVFVVRAGTQEIDPGSQIVTDANGTFEIPSREGAVDFHAWAKGWAAGMVGGLDASDDREGEVVIALKRGGTLRVRVTGSDEEPLAGARLTIQPLEPSPVAMLALLFDPPRATDPSGETRVDSLSPGTYEVGLADRPDMTLVRAEVTADAEASVRLVVPDSR